MIIGIKLIMAQSQLIMQNNFLEEGAILLLCVWDVEKSRTIFVAKRGIVWYSINILKS